MAVSAKSVIQGNFIEAAFTRKMSMVHEERAVELVSQKTGLLAAAQS